MALTSYKSYRWLIETLEEVAPDGYTLPKLVNLYNSYRYKEESKLWKGEAVHVKGVSTLKRTTFLGWRIQIYNQFGLIIDTPVYDNYYVLTNPELLDENKTLRAMIDLLCSDEERGSKVGNTLSFSKRGRKPKKASTPPSDTMGFVSTGGEEWDEDMSYLQEPSMVDIIQFSMSIGEAMVIDYNKVGKTDSKDKTSVLEPQSLKFINGRWYVVGFIYKYGEKDPTRHFCIYDVERIKLCEDDEIINPKYTVDEDFDIYSVIPDDWKDHFDPEKVNSVYLKTIKVLFDNTTFCNAQEKVDLSVGMLHSLYKVYVRPDRDFIIQMLSYGDEVSIYAPFNKIPRTDIDLTDDQIGYLRGLKKSVF